MSVAGIVPITGIRMESLCAVILIVRLMGVLLLILIIVRSMRKNEYFRSQYQKR